MSKHRRDIQGLRAIAVGIVVLFHVSAPLAPGGFVGVDVFFVLSGFLISGMLIAEQRESGTVNLSSFYARRASRLLPAATAMLLITLCVSAILLSPAETVRIARTAIRAALYVSNISFARNVDYFDGLSSDEPLLHTWSLAIEEQFYIIWPVLLLFVGMCGGLRTWRRAAVVLAAISLVSLLASILGTARVPVAAFFLVPFRVWEFGAGALLAVYLGRSNASPGGLGHMPRWTGMASLVASTWLLSHETPFPGVAAIFPVVGTLLVISAGSEVGLDPLARLLNSKPLQLIGELSYGWYLWHWPLLCIAALTQPEWGVFPRALTAVVALVFAYASFRLIEEPIRRWGRGKRRPGKPIILGLALTGVTAVAAMGVVGWSAKKMFTPRFAQLEAARADRPRAASACQARYEETLARSCAFGDSTGSGLRIVVAGDSKAAQWAPALERISQSYGWYIVLMAKSSCPMESLSNFHLESLRRNYVECGEWRANVFRRILAIAPDVVLLAASKNYVVKLDAVADTVAWSQALGTTLDLLRAQDSAMRVLVLRDSPSFPWNVPDCLGRLHGDREDGASCRVARGTATSDLQFRSVVKALAGRDLVASIDLSDAFCHAEFCYPVVAGETGYTDADHVRASLAARLSNELYSNIAREMRLLPQ